MKAAAKPVFLRELAFGDRFQCGNGDWWIKGPLHGSHNDVFIAKRESDRVLSCFGGQLVVDLDTQN